ncbi:STAS domain-containing protein [Streptomyces carpinensis]|uniref:STAS domain-containing protein n=1 Tax=Streptomyces carpinensis TaxID=66369 RepID=A0ABV1W898_9ACTN
MSRADESSEQSYHQVNGQTPAAVVQYEARGAWVVVADGAYDMHSITPLADALAAAAAEHPKVVLDTSGVSFADSTFLNLLIRTHQETTLRVVAPTPQLQRILQLTGADTILEVRATVEDAVA